MDSYTLFSGSSGNCTYIKNNNTEILIDAGVSCKRISDALAKLGTGLENIKAIFITHEHTDHIKALPTIVKHFDMPIYMTRPSANAMCASPLYAPEFMAKNVRIIEPELSYDVNELLVTSFCTPHDSAASVGYIVENEHEAFGLATDIGHVTAGIENMLSICKRVVLESNHDITMLKNGPYPEYLKARILSDRGHLSNISCAHFALRLCEAGVESIMLSHLSRENNDPDTAYGTTCDFLSDNGVNLKKDLKLAVAAEDGISKL